MKLNSRGVKVRAFMVGLAALAYFYEVWWKSEALRDGQVTVQPASNAASNPAPGASAPPPEGGSSAAQQGP